MRNVLAIARKELSIYFTTPLAYIAFTAMVFGSAFFFLSGVNEFLTAQDLARQYGWEALGPDWARFRNLTDGVVMTVWNAVIVIILFVAPLFAMRLFAEERRNKTFELLMTAPVRPTEIVLGKFLGGLGIVWTTIGLTIVYPVILQVFGASESGSALEWSTVLLGYGGMFLWAATGTAVTMFISSLTDSQLLAAFLSIIVLLLWLLVSALAPGADEPFRSLLKNISVGTHLDPLMRGVLDLKSLVFFLSAIFFFVLLTQRTVEAQRWG